MKNHVFMDHYNHTAIGKKNAAGKAPQDCGRILTEYGYHGLHLYISRSDVAKSLLSWGRVLTMIPYKADVVIQYPLGESNFVITSILDVCRLKNCKITLLVHDLSSLRYSGHLSRSEVGVLSKANNIIVHNDAMKGLLSEYIPHARYYCLQAFDYFINRPARPHDFDNTIVYAGNLRKSLFLPYLRNLGVKFNLYGVETEELKSACNELVKYKGAFTQEDLSILSGDWGLVWDGTSATTCDGNMGHYMRYNAPHKLSLYLVAQLPVIIWSQAAEAKLIKENKLGILINSLGDIKETIQGITLEEYAKMKNNVMEYSKKLMRGGEFEFSIERNESRRLNVIRVDSLLETYRLKFKVS